MEAPGRLHQDDNFDVVGFAGLPVERLIGVVLDGEADKNPLIVNLKVEGKSWQKFFLDAWIGFWEDWGELVDDDNDDGTRFVDYSRTFDLKGAPIKSIRCRDCQIMIELENKGVFTLKLVNPKEDDMYSEVTFTKPHT